MEMTKRDKVILMICLCASAFMNLLDTTIVNVSLPHIAGTFGTAVSNGTWVITSYAVSEGITLPLIGWLSKRIGILRQFLLSTLIFTVFSGMCGLSPTFNSLLFFRVLQGVVGASMIPLSQTLIVALYPKEERAFPLGIWSMTVVFAPVAGPIIGGWITDNMSWRWAFYINLPIGIVAMFIAYLIYKKYDVKYPRSNPPVDMWGVVFLAIGIGCMQLVLDRGSQYNWFSNKYILMTAIVSFISLVTMVIWELGNKNPVINIRLFFQKNFLIGSISIFCAVGVIYAMIVVIPVWLQDYMGYTAFKSGTTLFYQSIPVLCIAPILGKFGSKVDARKLMATGFAIMALVAIFICPFPSNPTQSYISYTRLMFGFGMSLFFVPSNLLTFSEVSQEDMASASGLYNFMRNMGISFGTAFSTNFWDDKIKYFHNNLVSAINYGNTNLKPYMDLLPGSEDEKLSMINETITNQAATMAINHIFIITGTLLLIIIPIIFLADSTLKKKVN